MSLHNKSHQITTLKLLWQVQLLLADKKCGKLANTVPELSYIPVHRPMILASWKAGADQEASLSNILTPFLKTKAEEIDHCQGARPWARSPVLAKTPPGGHVFFHLGKAEAGSHRLRELAGGLLSQL